MTYELYDGPLQDTWSAGTCYGCGPANEDGLHIKSYWSADGEAVVSTFHPQAKHNAGFPNVMYGGLVASLMDCHSIWTAIADAYRREERPQGSDPNISYVTGKLEVTYLKPTPLDEPTHLRAVVEKVDGKRTFIHCTLGTEDQITAEAKVIAFRVEQDKSKGA